MNVPNFADYFIATTVKQLVADASAQHQAVWPAIERVIRARAAERSPIVIDGWFLRPEKVAALDIGNVTSFWLVADSTVFEERERNNVEVFSRSSDPERMLQNFLGRSRWHNDLIGQEAKRLNLKILRQDGNVSVDALCAIAMKQLDDDG